MKRSILSILAILSVSALNGCSLETVNGCSDNEHIDDGGYCVANTLKKCGSETVNCKKMPGWDKGECESGVCVASACQDGFHLHESACEEDTRENCGSHDKKCASNKICTNAKCKACPENTHVKGNECIQDTKPDCETIADCSDNQICSAGHCTACSREEHIENNLCVRNSMVECISAEECGDNRICHQGVCSECKASQHKDGEFCVENETIECVRSSDCQDTQICEETHCKTCPIGQHAEGDVCTNDTNEACGSLDNKCVDQICQFGSCMNCPTGQHISNGVCVIDKANPCKTTDDCKGNQLCIDEGCENCPQNQHVENDTCVEDSYLACGAKDIACTDQICLNGVCTPCSKGEHFSEGTCEPDSYHACGFPVVDCARETCDSRKCERCSEAKCELCQSGQHLADDETCVADDVTSCGQINCTAIEGVAGADCISSSCVISSCIENYCLKSGSCVDGTSAKDACWQGGSCTACSGSLVCVNGQCVIPECDPNICSNSSTNSCQNDNEHCGTACTNCAAIPNASSTCNTDTGTCQINSCDKGYHKDGQKCTKDTNLDCGESHEKCTDGMCVDSKCTYLTIDKPSLTLACSSSATTINLTLTLINPPSVDVNIELSLVTSSGTTSSDFSGIYLSPTNITLKDVPSKQISLRAPYSTPSNLNNNYYKGVQLKAVVTIPGYGSFTQKLGNIIYRPFCAITLNSATTSAKSYTLPAGKYSLYAYGAGGGGPVSNGGRGGSAYGTLTLSSKTTIYVNVGGAGKKCEEGVSCGGSNGGSPGSLGKKAFLGLGAYQGFGYGGGGASDIRIGSNSTSKRVIVAGGGGGAFDDATSADKGGDGGGSVGISGRKDGALDSSTSPGGQNGCSNGSKSLCKFGTANAQPEEKTYKGGGGGGWYGGMTGNAEKTSGAGGSGFVFTGVTTTYTTSGGTLTDTYKLSNAKTTQSGGHASGTDGSISIYSSIP